MPDNRDLFKNKKGKFVSIVISMFHNFFITSEFELSSSILLVTLFSSSLCMLVFCLRPHLTSRLFLLYFTSQMQSLVLIEDLSHAVCLCQVEDLTLIPSLLAIFWPIAVLPFTASFSDGEFDYSLLRRLNRLTGSHIYSFISTFRESQDMRRTNQIC